MDRIDTAFILAAGRGTRMAPLTDHLPKPLVRLGGRPLLDYIFAHLKKAGVSRAVVNLHHHADRLGEYLGGVSGIDVVPVLEEILLETGGGLKNAASLLPQSLPFFVINGDAFWTDRAGDIPALDRLAQAFDSGKMDILLLLIPVNRMVLTQGVGDYDIAPDGTLSRSKAKSGTHMFTGIRVIHPRILPAMKAGIYSFLEQMDEAEAKGRLYGLVHSGDWHHISTPEDLSSVERALVTAG